LGSGFWTENKLTYVHDELTKGSRLYSDKRTQTIVGSTNLQT